MSMTFGTKLSCCPRKNISKFDQNLNYRSKCIQFFLTLLDMAYVMHSGDARIIGKMASQSQIHNDAVIYVLIIEHSLMYFHSLVELLYLKE